MSLLSRSRTEVVQALLDAGANVNQRAGTGVPPIFYALPRGLPMVKMLINAGADVTVLDPSGQSADRADNERDWRILLETNLP
ncbi:hypothetical protein, partial [Roseicyclus sp.]|uniref:hypothetical protein n=1 Tax=Roseicyclus sp. TaxID=1914329 RepID=UPI0040546131